MSGNYHGYIQQSEKICITYEQHSFWSKCLHNRSRGGTRESGQSMTLNHAIAASQGGGNTDGGEGLAVG